MAWAKGRGETDSKICTEGTEGTVESEGIGKTESEA